MNRIKVQNKLHLEQLIEEHIQANGHACDLNHFDVSDITDMSMLFFEHRFDGDISCWDVSKVNNMYCMFYQSDFNGDISQWNTSRANDMGYMFYESIFQGDISQWDVAQVTEMNSMFRKSIFNGDISRWNTFRVESIDHMFSESLFNGDISKWDLSHLVLYEDAFSQFNDSPLGYIGVLQSHYEFPKDHSRAAQFEHLRSLCDGLNMDALSAARFIYQQRNSMYPAPIISPMDTTFGEPS